MNPVYHYLAEVFERYRQMPARGALADYIPELARVDPNGFALAISTVDGHSYCFGDYQQAFTIQSVSKPFVYGMALQEYGVDKVLQTISVEPSGDAFNSISLYPESGRPFNPMINAGAIAASQLLWKQFGDSSFDRILECFSNYAGAELALDESVFQSETVTGHRNRAIAHLLRNFDIFDGEVDAPLEVYFKQCSINVNCSELSLMGATLANNGVHPLTGCQVLDGRYVSKVLSVMSTCGMYDYSGEWIYRVGVPAKSGVGGGVMAVLPGQMAIAVYSPLLDEKGNSVKGVQLCEEIASHFSLHMFHAPRLTRQVLRSHNTLCDIRSNYKHDSKANEIFERHGDSVNIIELQGELCFATVEVLLRTISKESNIGETLVLNVKRCHSLDHAALMLILDLHRQFDNSNKRLLITEFDHLPELTALMEKGYAKTLLAFTRIDDALLDCENCLLRQQHHVECVGESKSLAQQLLLQGLDENELILLAEYLEQKVFAPGSVILQQGTPATHMYFIENGEASVLGRSDDNKQIVLNRLTAGNSFGEMAMIENKVRSASVRAESTVRCWCLPFGVYHDLENRNLSRAKIAMLSNLSRFLSVRLRQATAQIESYF